MKKYILVPALLVALMLIVSCAATKAEEAVVIEEPAVISEPPVPEEAPPAAETVAMESEPEVLPAKDVVFSAEDEDLDQKFSYVYGHLLADNIISQGIEVNMRYFSKGSTDFFQYLEPAISDEQINTAFLDYQAYMEGTLTKDELLAGSDESSEIPLSSFDRFSYAYGYIIMYNLQSQGIIVSLEDYLLGVSDAFAYISLPYTDEQINALFVAYEEKLMATYSAMIEQIAEENLRQAETFLDENSQLADVITTESGLQYKIVGEGEGEKPTTEDTVKLDYRMTFLDGSVGDSSYSRGEPSIFALSDLIPGFSEGLMLMPVGSHYQFYVHPSLAYGVEGNETTPPNALLIFDVELHEIVTE